MGDEMKHKWADLIHAWADGAEIEGHDSLWPDDLWRVKKYPRWNSNHWIFRLADPYRELKEAAKDPTKEIRVAGRQDWCSNFDWHWCYPPDRYEIRDKPAPQPKTRKVKLHGWYSDGVKVFQLQHLLAGYDLSASGWKRTQLTHNAPVKAASVSESRLEPDVRHGD